MLATVPLRAPRLLPAALRLWAWITIPPSLSCSTRGGLDAPFVGACHLWAARVQHLFLACRKALTGPVDLVYGDIFRQQGKVASAVGKPTHRCVMRAEFGHEVAFGEDILTFTIEGNAFLHSMVRTIVGTLVEIGMHRREPEWMREVIDACDRTAAGPTAPACGLTFMGVDYDPAELVVLD